MLVRFLTMSVLLGGMKCAVLLRTWQGTKHGALICAEESQHYSHCIVIAWRPTRLHVNCSVGTK